MKLIPLSKGFSTVVDDEDFERFGHIPWGAQTSKKNDSVYAVRSLWLPGGVQTTLYLHREILGASPEQHVDHRDRNQLNNLRQNLRLCSVSQNLANQKRRADNSSGFKGVSWQKCADKWMAYITVNMKRKYLGLFVDPVMAARAYDTAATECFGEFARLNFPLTPNPVPA